MPGQVVPVELQQVIGSLERLGGILFGQINAGQQFACGDEIRAKS